MYCVHTTALSHRFSASQQVLKEIELAVPTGSIYGFLGPNGAGKTTTLRLLLGLIKKQQGEILLFDQPLHLHRLQLLRQTGSMIEVPSLYGHLTAKENLLIWQKLYQCPKPHIAEALQIVGLADTGNKRVRQFSLGMKQRLSIATAILHQPALLILDEPTNGLDPYGIIEMRDLLKTLNTQHGITIVISSHLLAEIEKLVTHTGIISAGRIVFQGTLNELVSRQQSESQMILQTANNTEAAQIVKTFVSDVVINAQHISMPLLSKEKIAALHRALVQHKIDVYEMNAIKKELETIFMELINQTKHD